MSSGVGHHSLGGQIYSGECKVHDPVNVGITRRVTVVVRTRREAGNTRLHHLQQGPNTEFRIISKKHGYKLM